MSCHAEGWVQVFLCLDKAHHGSRKKNHDLEGLIELELHAVKIDMQSAVKEKQRLDSKVEGV